MDGEFENTNVAQRSLLFFDVFGDKLLKTSSELVRLTCAIGYECFR